MQQKAKSLVNYLGASPRGIKRKQNSTFRCKHRGIKPTGGNKSKIQTQLSDYFSKANASKKDRSDKTFVTSMLFVDRRLVLWALLRWNNFFNGLALKAVFNSTVHWLKPVEPREIR